MYSSKLIVLMRGLSAKDFKNLSKFARSPFHNQHKDIAALFEVLAPLYPEFSEKDCNKEKVYKKLFPGDKYIDERIRNIMSDLAQVIESFFSHAELEQQALTKGVYTLNAYKEQGHDKYFRSTLNKLIKQQEASPYRDLEFYFNQHLLEEEKYDFDMRTRNRNIGTSLQQVVDHLDNYYLFNKLRYCCEMINRRNILMEEYRLEMFDEVLVYMKKNPVDRVPGIQIYYQILLTLTEKDEENHYQKLIGLLDEYSYLFNKIDNKTFYAFAQNYCIKKINSGKPQYLNELFELNKKLIAGEFIYDGKHIPQWDFKNIVTTALRLKELDWVEEFIIEYKGKVEAKDRKNAFAYNMAYLNFYKEEYGKAIRLLQRVKFTDVFYNLDSKSMLLKSYYELEEYTVLFALSDTLKNYLRRNKQVSDYFRTIYTNLVRYLSKMAKYRVNRRDLPEKFMIEVEENNQVADKGWLKQKLKEFETFPAY